MSRFLIIVALVVFTGAVFAQGKKASDFELKTSDGKTVQLSQLKGKVVLLNFWATWCGPCRKEIPDFLEVYKEYKGKGFEIVGVSHSRTRSSQNLVMEEDEEPSPGEPVPMDKEPEPEPEPKAEPFVSPVGPSKKEREPSKLSVEGRSSPRVSPRERLSPKATSPALSPTSSLSPTPSPPDDPQRCARPSREDRESSRALACAEGAQGGQGSPPGFVRSGSHAKQLESTRYAFFFHHDAVPLIRSVAVKAHADTPPFCAVAVPLLQTSNLHQIHSSPHLGEVLQNLVRHSCALVYARLCVAPRVCPPASRLSWCSVVQSGDNHSVRSAPVSPSLGSNPSSNSGTPRSGSRRKKRTYVVCRLCEEEIQADLVRCFFIFARHDTAALLSSADSSPLSTF